MDKDEIKLLCFNVWMDVFVCQKNEMADEEDVEKYASDVGEQPMVLPRPGNRRDMVIVIELD